MSNKVKRKKIIRLKRIVKFIKLKQTCQCFLPLPLWNFPTSPSQSPELCESQNYLFVFFFYQNRSPVFPIKHSSFFLLHISLAEYPRSGSNIFHNLLPASSSSEEGSDIDTIAENQNTCPVKLVEGNQNNSAGLTTSSAGTDKVFGKSKISLWIFQ